MKLLLSLALGCMTTFAHDEGHGPKLTDLGKYGGLVRPVIDLKEAKRGAKALLLHKAELVRSEDRGMKVYLYDKDMNPLDLGKLEAKGKGSVETVKKGKATRVPFELTLNELAFTGSYPAPKQKPFNIDIILKEKGGRELLAAFDDLD